MAPRFPAWWSSSPIVAYVVVWFFILSSARLIRDCFAEWNIVRIFNAYHASAWIKLLCSQMVEYRRLLLGNVASRLSSNEYFFQRLVFSKCPMVALLLEFLYWFGSRNLSRLTEVELFYIFFAEDAMHCWDSLFLHLTVIPESTKLSLHVELPQTSFL